MKLLLLLVSLLSLNLPLMADPSQKPELCNETTGQEYPDSRSYVGFTANETIHIEHSICFNFNNGTRRTLALTLSGWSKFNNGTATELLQAGYIVQVSDNTISFSKAGAETFVLTYLEMSAWNGSYFYEARMDVGGALNASFLLREGSAADISERGLCERGYRLQEGEAQTLVSKAGQQIQFSMTSCGSLISMGGRRILPVKIELHDTERTIDASILYPDPSIQYFRTHHNDNDAILFSLEAKGIAYSFDGRVLTVQQKGKADEIYYEPLQAIAKNRTRPFLGFLDFWELAESGTSPQFGAQKHVLYVESSDSQGYRTTSYLDPRVNKLPVAANCATWDKTSFSGQVILASEATRAGMIDSGLFLIRLDNANCFVNAVVLLQKVESIAAAVGFDDGLYREFGSLQGWPSLPYLLIKTQVELDQLLKIASNADEVAALKKIIILESTLISRK